MEVKMRKQVQAYIGNGIRLSKASPKVGDKITLYYNGILPECGADAVYANIGYGDEWDDKEFLYMDEEEGLFKVKFTVKQSGNMQICFKDGANNWDNNSLLNYTFNIK
jgi:hypothetical protein